jgi:hypothetical protein
MDVPNVRRPGRNYLDGRKARSEPRTCGPQNDAPVASTWKLRVRTSRAGIAPEESGLRNVAALVEPAALGGPEGFGRRRPLVGDKSPSHHETGIEAIIGNSGRHLRSNHAQLVQSSVRVTRAREVRFSDIGATTQNSRRLFAVPVDD